MRLSFFPLPLFSNREKKETHYLWYRETAQLSLVLVLISPISLPHLTQFYTKTSSSSAQLNQPCSLMCGDAVKLQKPPVTDTGYFQHVQGILPPEDEAASCLVF